MDEVVKVFMEGDCLWWLGILKGRGKAIYFMSYKCFFFFVLDFTFFGDIMQSVTGLCLESLLLKFITV